jgi:CheY-like chemotaxis protein
MEVAAEAADGEEALTRLDAMGAHRELPDVVLIDLLMPKMDGVTAIGVIKQRPRAPGHGTHQLR